MIDINFRYSIMFLLILTFGCAKLPDKETSKRIKIIPHGKILDRPIRQPEGTKNSVSYELGKCFQLDRTHSLLVASMDEQGGHDMCVGNDGFIFEKLSDIKAENAIPLNRPEVNYKLKRMEGSAWLAKFPGMGGFVPLGAKLENGKPHPAAGTGVLVSCGVTYHSDRTVTDQRSEVIMEVMQLRWDGKTLTIEQRSFMDEVFGFKLVGVPLSNFCPQGETLLSPFRTDKGIVVYRWEFDGKIWHITESGEPFICNTNIEMDGGRVVPIGESEPSLQRQGDRYLISTRGQDPIGRVYSSMDGMNYDLLFERKHNTIPQALNQGLDGSLYLATNPNWDIVRNPLIIYPMEDKSFGQPILIHDEDGIRDTKGDKIPFIDHGVGVNLYIEGRWRHLLWYRVCDLKERTMMASMAEAIGEEIYGPDGGPKKRGRAGGLYMAEIEYDQITNVPFGW
jgi:hypothetical protein